RWALATACTQGAAWHDRGYRFPVSVNIAIGQFDDPDFDDSVRDALSSSQLDPSLLILEFPFSILGGDETAVRDRFTSLSEHGVRLAIDDLLPSDASFALLERFPISVVKLDRQFIADVSNSTSSQALVAEFVQIAKTRRLQIVAAGVEDADQRRRLQLDQISTGQGFLFSQPREASEIDKYLEDFSIFSGKPL
ncbi:MAG: EAL domain-containing protein, partial [Acidimicrobiales bacterium]